MSVIKFHEYACTISNEKKNVFIEIQIQTIEWTSDMVGVNVNESAYFKA